MTTMNNAATGGGTQAGFIEETVYGTTPATPSLTALRNRPFSFSPEVENYINREVGNNRIAKGVKKVFERGSVAIPMDLIYGNADAILEAIMKGTWTGAGTQTLANGSVNRAFSLEQHRADAATPYFILARGTMFHGFEIAISADGSDPVLLTLNGQCAEISPAAATVDAGSGYTAAPGNTPVDAGEVSFQIDAAGIDIIGATFTYNDAIDAKRECGSKTPTGFNPAAGGRSGQVSLTGYAVNKDAFDRMKADAQHAFTATAVDAEGNTLVISAPVIKPIGAYQESADDGSIRWEQTFEAFDPAGGTVFSFTRTPA
ncbi:phage tail tube protein [Maricaulis sp. MIT060901]|uniref:phage tail tube protein n=1 Tax=Maricaulis sp. MIT060901 TaxID=3096993 RepID=UPI0039996AA6